MILCVDSGNTRLKWACVSEVSTDNRATVLLNGDCRQTELAQWQDQLAAIPKPNRICIANVAGAEQGKRIEEIIKIVWGDDIRYRFIAASAHLLGVYNNYRQPAQLGVDRWCALVAAHQQMVGNKIVVCLGTATTIDTLTADGDFVGGLIVPGIGTMLHSLNDRTAQLPLVSAEAGAAFNMCATSTSEAIASGAIVATIGAIRLAFEHVPTPAHCILTGGNVDKIAQQCPIPYTIIEDLVVQGVYYIDKSMYTG